MLPGASGAATAEVVRRGPRWWPGVERRAVSLRLFKVERVVQKHRAKTETPGKQQEGLAWKFLIYGQRD